MRLYVSLASAIAFGACTPAPRSGVRTPVRPWVAPIENATSIGPAAGSGPAEPSFTEPEAQPSASIFSQPTTLHWPESQPESSQLPSGLHNPMPGGRLGGYPQDTGLDIAGFEMPVHAVADATVVYSEAGHSRWPRGSRYSILLRLDEPIPWQGRRITHAWYTHLKSVLTIHPKDATVSMHVAGGVALGISGYANRSPHLHLGLLLDDRTDQRSGTYLLFDEVREVLGDYRAGQRLP